ncbi:MAG: DUF2510 domain-containing protein [Aeromicrobium sp.]|uniref:DUF2510 domain-containing protein n=1 Tax=Aeromicrobium sp. TaxID=1871063 RepID=UPI0039E2DAD6
MTQLPPAGWYPDGRGGRRWWDGVAWTDHGQPAKTDRSLSGQGRVGLIVGGVVAAVVLLIVVPLVLVVVLDQDGPEEVAVKWTTARVESDSETLCRLSSDTVNSELFGGFDGDTCAEYGRETRSELNEEFAEIATTYDELLADVDTTVQVLNVEKRSDNRVLVKVRWTQTYHGDDLDIAEYIDENVSGQTLTLTVMRKDGQWLVHGVAV